MAKFKIGDRVEVIQVVGLSGFQSGFLNRQGIIQEEDDVPYVEFETGVMCSFLEEWLELVK